MVDHETEDDQPAHEHRSRCDCGSLIIGDGVFLRLREAVLLGELNRCYDMRDKCRQQENPNDPEDRPKIVQEFCIRIDPALPNIDLKVSHQMSKNIQDENQRGKPYNNLFADG